MGDNYVLGNRDDKNEFKPYKVSPKMFKEQKVVQLSSGINHVVALTLSEGTETVPAMDLTKFQVIPTQFVDEPASNGKENAEESQKEAVEEVVAPATEEKAEGEGIAETNSLAKRDITSMSNIEDDGEEARAVLKSNLNKWNFA